MAREGRSGVSFLRIAAVDFASHVMNPDELLAESNAPTQSFSRMNPVGQRPTAACLLTVVAENRCDRPNPNPKLRAKSSPAGALAGHTRRRIPNGETK